MCVYVWGGVGRGVGGGGAGGLRPLFPDGPATVFLFTPRGFHPPLIFHWLSGRIIPELSSRGKNSSGSTVGLAQRNVWIVIGRGGRNEEMSVWRFHSYHRTDVFKCIAIIFFLHCFDYRLFYLFKRPRRSTLNRIFTFPFFSSFQTGSRGIFCRNVWSLLWDFP